MTGPRPTDHDTTRIVDALRPRSIALVGLMGAGKTTVGRRLAATLGLPFADADHEIETAAGMSIPEIFERHGEAHFRDGERRVIGRLVAEGPMVLSTGGGAYMDKATRDLLAAKAVTVWLRAELDLLVKRTARRGNRPLLKSDPGGTLARLIEERYPVYAQADITVDSRDAPHEAMVEAVVRHLDRYLTETTHR